MPTGNDIRAFAQASGFVDTPLSIAQGAIDWNQAAAEALATWETGTKYSPFLAESVDSTSIYSPLQNGRKPTTSGYNNFNYGYSSAGGSNRLFFAAGYISVTSVIVNITTTFVGTTLTQGSDYYLTPVIAPSASRPYTGLQFLSNIYGTPNSINVIGKRGYWTTVPDDAWGAVVRLAMIELMPGFEVLKSGGAFRTKQANLDVQWRSTGAGASFFSGQTAIYAKYVDNSMSNHRRRSIV